jgi:Ion channel
MTKANIFKTLLKGLLLYCGLILFWGTIIYFSNSAKFSSGTETPNFWECLYFSCITFATIGYGDIVPNEIIGQIIVILQSMSAIVFIGLFGGYITYQFLKRPKDIFLTDNIHIRLVNNNVFFSVRIGNKGKDIIDCTSNIDIIEIKNDVKWTIIKKEIKYTLLEKSWFIEIKLNNNADDEFLNAFRKFYTSPEKSMIRVLVMGTDIESGELVATSKYYKVENVKIGGRYIDIYHWNNLQTTKPNWTNLNKTKELTKNEQNIVLNLLQTNLDNKKEDYIASCNS